MSEILVIYEIRDHKIKKVSFEATSAAVELAKQIKATVSALLIDSQIGNLSSEPEKFGAEKVYVIESSELAKPSPDVLARIITNSVKKVGTTHIFMGATSLGKDIMPRVAYQLDSGLVQDIIGLKVNNGEVSYIRPVIAGKLICEVSLQSEYQLVTLRPNIFKPEMQDSKAEIIQLSHEIPAPKVIVEDTIIASAGKLDVSEADIIVSGGRGMQSPDNWHLIENLAEVIGAASGASRAVVDVGWRDHGEQVGQTGKTVSPNLYIACGISGAIQHQAGMASSKYIVAINKDPEAPIFKIADYGIVGDALEVLPTLTEALKQVVKE
jgi:electron transfer flavoprotein alpha subunit